tara:strand:+ start:1672 stop:1995 length:324 start_codon:yes stop_codon:yes gene_type:complete
MPFKRKGKCVFKITKSGKQGKKKGCSKSVAKAKKYVKALYANSDDIMSEIKDYFSKQKDEDYLAFDGHPLSSIENLMNPEKPAPWDHLTNPDGDEDADIEIKERIKD